MAIVIVTGSSGLIGSETARFFHAQGLDIVGIDNDMRRYFFGAEASTARNTASLQRDLKNFRHVDLDVRDQEGVFALFSEYGDDIAAVIHTAAQPSHDWAAREPLTDFTVNANGTLTLLEATRRYAPAVPFIFTSTNKVYGDLANSLPLVERELRWELHPDHLWAEHGFDETMSIDQSKHSIFGASKVAADVMTQEYGRYFGMNTVAFRGGCFTGPAHYGAELHGFLAYLVKCVVSGRPYKIFGYQGKQVRDNIHSFDLVNAFWHYFRKPVPGAVYNMGGSRHSNCSVLEAIQLIETIAGKKLSYEVVDAARSGDHIWWISDVRRFRRDYPEWRYRYDLESIIGEIVDAMGGRGGTA